MRNVLLFIAAICAVVLVGACASSGGNLAGGSRDTPASIAAAPTPQRTHHHEHKKKHGHKRKHHKRSHHKRHHAGGGSVGSFIMPNEVGKGLQAAQDDIQRVSHDPVFVSHSTDATGQNRFQIFDRDWKVCSQNVAPGTKVSAVAHIVFSAVKLDESCP